MHTLTIPRTGTWTLDGTHSEVGFTVRHLMAAKVRGHFRSVLGTLEIGETAETSKVEVSIDAASIDTGVEDRDSHLRSADFLAADRHSAITFVSTTVTDLGGGSYRVTGDLTIRGVTKPVELGMSYGGVINDPWGNEKAIFSAETVIDREAWGLTWNAPLEAGGWLVGKQIEIQIEVQAAHTP